MSRRIAPRFRLAGVRLALVAVLAAAICPMAGASAEERFLGIIPIPGAEDVRAQVIERQPREDWPFTVDRGRLLCVEVWGQPQIYFAETLTRREIEAGAEIRLANISIDPLVVAFEPRGEGTLVREGSVAEITRAMIPYVRTGRLLCDQDKGTNIGPREL